MKKKRIVVTGMGIVSCFGTDVQQFYQQLLAGKSGVVPIEDFPCADYPTRFAGVIRGFDPGDYIDKKQARRVDPFIRYAMVAGKKALEYGRPDWRCVQCPEQAALRDHHRLRNGRDDYFSRWRGNAGSKKFSSADSIFRPLYHHEHGGSPSCDRSRVFRARTIPFQRHAPLRTIAFMRPPSKSSRGMPI